MSRTLLEKLGWTAGARVQLFDVPPGIAGLDGLRDGAADGSEDGSVDGPCFLVGSCPDAASVGPMAARIVARYRTGGHLWLLYPKASGSIRTDINRDRGWEPMLAAGFLPVGQIAVDADWSIQRWRRRDEIKRLTRTVAVGAP